MGNCGEFCIFVTKIALIRYTHMRFTGNIDAKMDDKGRVFLPAAFRKILQHEEATGLVLRRDIFQKCLVLFPESVWNTQVDAITERTSPFDSRGRSALRGFVAGADSITMDGNGRILIPRRYLEAAGISGDVRFIGVDDTIEIWSREAADHLLENPEALSKDLEEMMTGFSSEIPF